MTLGIEPTFWELERLLPRRSSKIRRCILDTEMSNYFIIAPADSTLTDHAVQAKFPRQFVIKPNSAWAVSSNLLTCSDVRESLSDAVDGQLPCIVVRATDYNGWAKRELWERLDAWKGSPDG